jgi:hypothetical protein
MYRQRLLFTVGATAELTTADYHAMSSVVSFCDLHDGRLHDRED